MKILHTSDWHLGHSLYQYDRTEEQQSMLSQIRDIVAREQPDVFLLCGDVYHVAKPSAAVEKMFADAIVGLRRACPSMAIIAIAGNHDSGVGHERFSTPWHYLNVTTIGSIDKDNPGSHIIEIPGKGYVVAVPYCNERFLPDGFFQTLLDAVKARNADNLPVVMAAHTTVKGCDFAGHDNGSDRIVGGIDSIDVAQMGDGYDYLALGHIHKPQFVHTGRHNVRYSGTPIAVSFDEDFEHSVSIVEISRHGDSPTTRTTGIKNPWPLVSYPAEGTTDWDDAKAWLASYPADKPAYLRVTVAVEGFLPPNANSEALGLTAGKRCRFCLINSKRRKSTVADEKFMTINELRMEDPLQIALRYAADKGKEFDDELIEMFREAAMGVDEDNRKA